MKHELFPLKTPMKILIPKPLDWVKEK